MLTGIFTIIGVLIGFYLAKFNEVNFKFSKIRKKETKETERVGEPFVVATDEYKLEQEQKNQNTEEEILNVKDYIK